MKPKRIPRAELPRDVEVLTPSTHPDHFGPLASLGYGYCVRVKGTEGGTYIDAHEREQAIRRAWQITKAGQR